MIAGLSRVATGGLRIMFNINTRGLRQAIVPNHLLGRVMIGFAFFPLGRVDCDLGDSKAEELETAGTWAGASRPYAACDGRK